MVHFDCGRSYEQAGDMKAAAKAYLQAWKLNPQNARFPLFAGAVVHAGGNLKQALHIWSIGSDQDPMLRAAQYHDKADNETKEKSRFADLALRAHFSNLHRESLKKCGSPARLETSLWAQTHDQKVNYNVDALQPHIFYAPDLPPVPVFENSAQDWVKGLQAATADISSEYLTYMDNTQTAGAPYLDDSTGIDDACAHLKGKDTWTAVHLYKNGQEQDCLSRFPKTKQALQTVPLVHFHGRPMEVFFSVLKPGIHIPPHHGLANTRVTAHLPLIIPSKDCRIRVADHIHHWREGELFLFDDSWNHEAWNDSSETRVVLIFEAWRPDITVDEIKAIQASFEDRDNWLKARQIPEL